MEFLMQPINSRTLRGGEREQHPMEPLEYPMRTPAGVELLATTASSVDAQICAVDAGPEAGRAVKAQASDHFIEQIDPKTTGCTGTGRVRIGLLSEGGPHALMEFQQWRNQSEDLLKSLVTMLPCRRWERVLRHLGKPIENTRSCRCECPALIRLLRSMDNGWYIAEHRKEHSRSLSLTYGQGHRTSIFMCTAKTS
ncbi:hypothetical protein ACQJBY_061560 [Aegilops geniculata]